MEVKMKGWPQAAILYLTFILCFLAGFLDAGPLQPTKGHTSIVRSWHHTPTSHHGHHVPTHTAPNEIAVHQTHDMDSSASSLEHLSTIEHRNTDMALHNYALVCDDRVWTTMCAGVGYTCSSSGKLKYKHKDIMCHDICSCIDLVPAPKICVVNKASKQCSVVNDMVLDATSGELLGNVTESSILPDGSLDLTTTVAKRDTELSHDHALVCYDRTLTGLCQASAHGYFCNANGVVKHKGQAEVTCESHCICVNISPRPCFNVLGKHVDCGFKDNTVFDTIDGTALGNLSDAQVLDNGSLDFSHTKALEKRHDYGLICQDREHTAWCGSSYQYYCTARGQLKFKTTGEHWCEEHCFCMNLKPAIQCFPNAALLTTCLLKGKLVYNDNGTLLGNVSDAYAYPNGTLDFRKVVTRDLDVVSADPQKIICKSQQSTQVAPFSGGLLYDKNLTTFCASHGYSCATDPTRAALTLTLQPGSKVIKECVNSCACQSQTWKREGSEVLSQPPQSTGGVTIQDLLLGCSSNNGLTKGTWSFDESLTQDCKNKGYNCAILPGSRFVLQHSGGVVASCQAGCSCPASPTPAESAASSHQKARASTESETNDMAAVQAVNKFDPFGMTCASRGRNNETLTNYCRDEGYSCVSLTGTYLRTLSHNSTDIPECTHGCRCRNPFAREKRYEDVEMSATADEIPDTTAVAPPSGVPSQSSSSFALNCGNVADGPGFCQQPDLGYFCAYNMTVMRTSSVQNQGVTWCDYYCSCIFKNPVPCVNEWNVPLCREMPDGTVRDASRMQIVLAYIENVIILPNNSILLDRGQDGGFPFVVASHGRHGPSSNDSSHHWTDWPTNGTNGTNGTTNGLNESGQGDN
ncbi:hypothetical protein Z517_02600 [Fonsecaea pedrosoi CBS 271.37]|uniref:Unplaced genomic scaffold supercont1.2, whole genome shotgun sequence n=1 Tax=Fonsecaea pedrosoi CBS 271.37 TaxID=1442368 RepID=A0A0D2GXJ7_9EURO|nr:uncharacterized protein Z517_02600 [Fonsecaea pedrosoi CBS 271.37]KIW83355.1 hypothetical protein Z517_02600 [Fonsecaea pedrosoi CBS 271.37]